MLNGHARFVKYTNHSLNKPVFDKNNARTPGRKEDLELELIEIAEGQFKKAKKDGYCRVISAKDGSCEVGFFKDDKPHGKYVKFAHDGR